MNVAVYDKFWAAMGGGEKYAAGVADVLSHDHDVTLLADEPIDLARLGDDLALDLSRVQVQEIGPTGSAADASADYDLFVNLSYRSDDRNRATHGIYVVHFPHDPTTEVPARLQALLRRVGPRVAPVHRAYSPLEGFWPAVYDRWHHLWWTDGDGVLAVGVPAGARTHVRLFLAPAIPENVSPLDFTVEIDGTTVASSAIRATRFGGGAWPTQIVVPVRGHDDGSRVELHLRSDSFVPHDLGTGGDTRRLGLPLVGVAVGRSPAAFLRGLVSMFDVYPPELDFLDTYDTILANSQFTQRWITNYWRRDTEVLYPPVTCREPGDKDRIILSVGRFFGADAGHSKKQVEMAEAFRQLRDRGTADGWTLHFVGACRPADEIYLERVVAAAHQLPVEFHVNASGDELDALYRRAAIYWHATGLGADPDDDPESSEHFGITTVEAMSAGAVPIVIGQAGPIEAVDDGVSGFHFATVDELVDRTERVIGDGELRARLGAAAHERAQRFGMASFAERLRGQVAALSR